MRLQGSTERLRAGDARDEPALPARRRFVTGLAASGVVSGLGLWTPAWARSAGQTPRGARATARGAQETRGAQEILTGTEFDLVIGETPMAITGAPRTAITVNGTLPAPLLRWREGETVTVRVSNRLRDDTSIHWHGIVLPAAMDGVPGLSFDGIGPAETFVYRFQVRQAGTYWYHSHSGFQEQQGLYGPLVIDPREPDPIHADREHVVLLSDWTDENPMRVFRKLKKQADYYNRRQRTFPDFVRDAGRDGVGATLSERRAWGLMRMSASDLSDVSAMTYTYLMNGAAPDGNWTGLFRPGENVRLRFINGSAMTHFDVRIPGLRMTVVAADGLPVHPVTVDEFRIAVAETFDVIVEPSGQDAYTLVAQSLDRTGYARGTLAVREGLAAPVPPLDPRPVLTMADMGHGDHAPDTGAADATAPAGRAGAAAGDPHAGHAGSAPPDPHAAHGSRPSSGQVDPHAGQMPATAAQDPRAGHGASGSAGIAHPATERRNPLVDMQTKAPSARLSDPGIGLRDNGRRVLAYADLKSVFEDPDPRDPGRTVELHLTGHMERYAWSFNGVKFASAEPLRFTYGERLRVVLVNDTMMTHPIHLHGMWSDLEDESGRFLVRKHTVDMPPGTRRTYRVTADALGRWAYHCHLMLHMEAGMMREVWVDI